VSSAFLISSQEGPRKDCTSCFEPAYKMYKSLGLTVRRYSDFLSSDEIKNAEETSSSLPFQDISRYEIDGMAVGEHALAGALRFFAVGMLNGEPYGEQILRRYFEASLLTVFAVQNMLKKLDFSSSVFHHGIYVPQGLIGEVCRQKKVHVVNWNPAYRKQCFIFDHDDTYHHTMMTEPSEKWLDMPWNGQLESKLMEYLKSRWRGTEDWIWFHNSKPQFEFGTIAAELGIDPDKPCIGMLTSVMWDAVLHYPSNAFGNMLEWVTGTIDYFIERQDLQLIIRIHPAEVRGTLPSRQRIADEIEKAYPNLPKNIIVIPPESDISTYAVMTECDSVIIYNTKTGVELAAMGIPVIVAGEAWIRNKGFALDVSNPDDYRRILDSLPLRKRMSDEDVCKAQKYAYHFFFRRMIPLEFMKPVDGVPPYRINLANLAGLSRGASKGLDVICDGILNREDFILG
ncbi:MAG: capsule biosynthesis protein, partial [Planctomycetota bacterium]|nr:capsule biosynthesis protein [Planctomycetota bacterium]